MEEYDEFNYDSFSDDEDSVSEESDCMDNIVDDDNDDHESGSTVLIRSAVKEYCGMPFITKFERARILGIRTEQIMAGSQIFVDTLSTDPYEIAEEELKQKKMPLLLRRFIHNKYIEISVNVLEDIYV